MMGWIFAIVLWLLGAVMALVSDINDDEGSVSKGIFVVLWPIFVARALIMVSAKELWDLFPRRRVEEPAVVHSDSPRDANV